MTAMAMGDRHDEEALQALVDVTSAPEVVGRLDETLAALLARVVAAAEADAGVFWARPGHSDAPPLCIVVGAPADAQRRLRGAFSDLRLPDAETGLAVAAGNPLAAVLGPLGASAGYAVPIVVGGTVDGAVVVATGAPAPPRPHPVRVHAVRVGARLAGRLIDSARLRDDLGRAMEQILLTDERMLGRMGLDIHDGPTQQLSVALLEVQLLEAELADAQDADLPASLRPALGRIYETVGGALHEMRELIGHLRPAQFEDRRLADILKDAIAAFERRTDCVVVAEWQGEFPVNGVSITQRITLYRILQETLANAHRHGNAQVVRVVVTEDATGTTLEVHDDGTGFDVAAHRRRGAGPPARFGLAGMCDRAEVLGGRFDITSSPDEGTTVRVFLPRWIGSTVETRQAAT
jgi:signal transduction histidine kinase